MDNIFKIPVLHNFMVDTPYKKLGRQNTTHQDTLYGQCQHVKLRTLIMYKYV